MPRSERIRRLLTLAPWTALVLGIGCGGGDKGPTGPGADGPDSYELVSLGRMGLPADVQVEDCIPTRFFGGGLRLDEDGTWQLELEFYDDNYGNATASDEGEFQEDGGTVWLGSANSGVVHQGTLDGGELKIMYDWCYNGVADVQLVFDR